MTLVHEAARAVAWAAPAVFALPLALVILDGDLGEFGVVFTFEGLAALVAFAMLIWLGRLLAGQIPRPAAATVALIACVLVAGGVTYSRLSSSFAGDGREANALKDFATLTVIMAVAGLPSWIIILAGILRRNGASGPNTPPEGRPPIT